jgi:DNA-directed RNA polymerase subunit RPC12/RpoP
MYEYRCTRCNSLIQFCWDDVYADQRDGAYVKCPVCQVFIAWENVKQRGKQILK